MAFQKNEQFEDILKEWERDPGAVSRTPAATRIDVERYRQARDQAGAGDVDPNAPPPPGPRPQFTRNFDRDRLLENIGRTGWGSLPPIERGNLARYQAEREKFEAWEERARAFEAHLRAKTAALESGKKTAAIESAAAALADLARQ